MFLGLWDIASILAYVLAFALVESVIVAFLLACLLSLLRMVFPNFLGDEFVPISSVMVFINAFWAFVFHRILLSGYVLSWSLGRYLLSVLLYTLSIGVSVVLLHRLDAIAKGLRLFAERLVVFLYLYVPLSVIGGLVVLVRNIG
jgi:hypothetical protein